MENKMEIKYCGTFEIDYQIPEWNESDDYNDDNLEQCFECKEGILFLSEFMSLHNKVHFPHCPERWRGFDGYQSTSFFDGYLVKIVESGDAVKLYHYFS